MYFLSSQEHKAAQQAGISEEQVALHQQCAGELSRISMKWYTYDARKAEQRLNLLMMLGLLAIICGVNIWSSPSPLIFYYWGAVSALVMLVFSCLMVRERTRKHGVTFNKLLKKPIPSSKTEKVFFAAMLLLVVLPGILLAENLKPHFSGTMLGALVMLQILVQAGLLHFLVGATDNLWQAHTDLQRLNRELGYREDALSDVLNHFQQTIRVSPREAAQANQQRQSKKRQVWLLLTPLAVLMALFIAYFGGVSLAQQTGSGFIYLGGLRINPMFHFIFASVITAAELLMAQAFFCFLQARSARRAMRMGWSVNERVAAEGLLVPGRQELRAQRRWGLGFLLGGLVFLVIDMALNIKYFIHVQRLNLFEGILVSLIPASLVVAIALYLAHQKHKLSRHEHFGYLPSQAENPVPVSAELKQTADLPA